MFQKIIRALGFSTDNEEEIQEISSESVNADKDESLDSHRHNEGAQHTPDNRTVSADLAPLLSEMIYNEVIKDIRRSLEDVVRKAGTEGLEHGMSQLKKISDEIDDLRRKNSMFEERCNEFQESQLSTERQKRAYVTRIENLEKQTSQLEAEKEQLRLENRNMSDKLRVASVVNSKSDEESDDDPELIALKEENQNLVQENESLKQEYATLKEEYNRLKEEKETLEDKIEELNIKSTGISEEILSGKESEIAELTSKYNEVINKNESLGKELDQRYQRIIELESSLEGESNIRTELENSLDKAESRIAKLSRLVEEKDLRNQELDDIRKKRDVKLAQANASINRLKADSERKDREAKEEITSLRQRISELEITESSLEESRINYIRLKEEADKYSAAEAQLHAEIDRLTQRVEEAESLYKAALASLEEQIAQPLPTKRKRGRPRKDNMTQSSPDTDMISSKSDRETVAAEPQTRGYIDPDTVLDPDRDAPVREEATIASKRKVKPVISAIDELLDSADWLEAPKPSAKPQEKPKEDDDFGYKAPPKKQNLDNDAQMSLW